MVGIALSPPRLATDGLLGAFATGRATAIKRYGAFVSEGINTEPIWNGLKSQAFLGDDDFVMRHLEYANAQDDVNIPKAQRRAPPPSLEAIAACHASGGYSYTQIAEYFGLHFTTVGRIVRSNKSN